jgi:hypothetical protein
MAMFMPTKNVLFCFVLTLQLTGFVRAACPVGDVNGDCKVDMGDLQVVADQWLASSENRADLNGDDRVSLLDVALMAENWYRAGIPLVINEILASNSDGLPDPQGQYDDWIEIFNSGDEPIDIAGMYLTDDLDEPTKWQIPTDSPAATTITGHGYLLIWADTDTEDPGLHANFNLSSDGEDIALVDRDGSTVIDSISFGEQRSDISYGRYPDAGRNLRFMAFPTPRTANQGAYLGSVADTKFSRDRGFYDAPFEVTITCETPDATIWYTTDGSEPYRTTGRFPTGRVYTGPISITGTTCLRAKAIKPGWMSSNVDTHTYIFLEDTITRSQAEVLAAGYPSTWHGGYPADYEMDPQIYNNPAYRDLMDEALLSLPTVSMVTDKDNLFSHENDAEDGGIYIYTGHGSTGGRGWERAVSVEFFDPNRTKEFQINCGVRIQGGENRKPQKCPKHGFGLRFRGKYGAARLEFPLFDAWPVDSFDTIQFRGFFNNSWVHWSSSQRARTQYIRDQWMRDSLTAMGHADAGQGVFVHLYLNGIYWGLYNLQERPVASHYAVYNGGDSDRIDAVNGGSPRDGNLIAWNEMKSIVAGRNWQEIRKVMDVNNFIDWTIAQQFAGNTDLKNNGNWRAAGGGPDRRPWHFYSWDAEHVMESLNQSGTRPSSDPTRLYGYLEDMPEFRMRFADRIHKHFFNGGALTPERNIQRWNKRADEIDLAVIAESARWGDYRRDMHSWSSGPYELYTKNDFWVPEKNNLLHHYFPSRTSIVLDQYKNLGLYPNVAAPVFYVNGLYQHGGHIGRQGMLAMTAAGGSIYYTLDGSDPRLPQTSQPDTSTILVAEDAPKRVLVPSGPVSGNWKGGGAFDDSAWNHGTYVPNRAGGIGYDERSDYQPYISYDVEQLMNGDINPQANSTFYTRVPFTLQTDPGTFNYMSLSIRYDDAFVAYLNGTEIARANCSATPSWNSQADGNHEAGDPESVDVSQHLDALRQGDNILAVQGLNVHTGSSDLLVSAELVAGEKIPSGISPTALEYTEPITLTESTYVKARVLDGGSWSALNEAIFAVGPVAENLRITEMMYHPADTNEPNDPNEEFIELQNIGAQTINLNLVRFTNGVDFVFPSIELAPDEYILVVKDQPAFAAQYPDFSGVIAGQYSGSLANNGERIELQDATGRVIHDFRYGDGWRRITDGDGFSLTIIDPANPDPNSWSEKESWRASAFYGGSPGWDDTGIVPEPGAVVINELLAHSHAAASDWIELHNTTDKAINIGGWFLSDDADDLTKYEIAEDTTILPDGYVVFYEDVTFGNIGDPGCHVAFALSENGEAVYLSSAQEGVLTGYQEVEDFGASETGVAFGRYYKPSTDNFNFVAMGENTPNAANAYPKVGPIVINEIMYNPASDNQNEEYIELHNITGAPVALYRYDKFEPWKFTDGIEFTFPSDPIVTIPAYGYVLVVKDVDAFTARYGSVPTDVAVLGPYEGQLRNGGEKVELGMPGDVDLLGTQYYIRVDRVSYSDGSHPEDCPGEIDLWPSGADGGGSSLSRIEPSDYGNDVVNWQAAAPSPGQPNP